MKKILITAHNIGKTSGGLHTGTVEFANFFKSKGYDITLITHSSDHLVIPKFINLIISKNPFRIKSFNLGLINLAIIKAIKETDVVILQGLYQFINFQIAVFSIIYNKKIIIRPFGSLDPSILNNNFLKYIYIFLFESPISFFASFIWYSSNIEKTYSKIFYAKNCKNLILGEPININKISHIDKNYNTLNFLHLSRIDPKKNIQLSIDFISGLRRLGFDAKIFITGNKSGKYYDDLKKYVDSNNLIGVYFTGFINEAELISLYNTCPFLISSSNGENFGISILEAVVNDLIPIIPYYLGISDKISCYEAGLVCNQDINSYLDTFLDKYPNNEFFKKLNQNGRNLIENEFSYDSIYSQIHKYL
jgi:glycosyltransferase involved in cell wall biosynthesis